MLHNRKVKKPKYYKNFSYIFLDPSNFFEHQFVSDEIRTKIGGSLFRIIPDNKEKVHVLLCLPEKLKSTEENNSKNNLTKFADNSPTS